MLILKHKSAMPAQIAKRHGEDAVILDLTSKGPEPWVRFSPFYPHGDIPVPFSEGVVSQSVEGAWQGLKVFESQDVDLSKMAVTHMRGIKRTVRRLGAVRGHRRGVRGEELLGYLEARWELYLPMYLWVLENRLQEEVGRLREAAQGERAVVLLDYETNGSVVDLKKPLSHAALVKRYVEGRWPRREEG